MRAACPCNRVHLASAWRVRYPYYSTWTEQVIQQYLRECIRYDSLYQNAKYTVMEMLTKRRHPDHLKVRTALTRSTCFSCNFLVFYSRATLCFRLAYFDKPCVQRCRHQHQEFERQHAVLWWVLFSFLCVVLYACLFVFAFVIAHPLRFFFFSCVCAWCRAATCHWSLSRPNKNRTVPSPAQC